MCFSDIAGPEHSVRNAGSSKNVDGSTTFFDDRAKTRGTRKWIESGAEKHMLYARPAAVAGIQTVRSTTRQSQP